MYKNVIAHIWPMDCSLLTQSSKSSICGNLVWFHCSYLIGVQNSDEVIKKLVGKQASRKISTAGVVIKGKTK